MYSLKVKKEFLYEQKTIKIMINDEVRDRTSREKTVINGKPGDEQLYLKALVLRTNKIATPKEHGVYNLTWRQNYLYVGLLILAIAYYAFTILLADGQYETSERIVFLLIGGFVVNLTWNDLLILGRKIKIEKEEL